MAGKEVFLDHGFTKTAEREQFEPVIHPQMEHVQPRLLHIDGSIARYRGLHIADSDSCPMILRSLNDPSEMAVEYGLKLRVPGVISMHAAQKTPSQ